ncbi:hypothetical protein B0H11DRAFT_1909774 [Mycena galericulata]|nr:hypothetical protein B0H11DRAFT_1909774 [Mycena galericulata]
MGKKKDKENQVPGDPKKKRLCNLLRLLCGIRSSAIEKPPGDPGIQTQLATRPSGSQSIPGLTPELYACMVFDESLAVVVTVRMYSEFIKYREALSDVGESRSRLQNSLTTLCMSLFLTREVDEEEAEGSPQPRQAGRCAHTAGAAASKTQRKVSTAAHAAGKADTPAPVKGKQSTNSDDDTALPDNIAAAFMANSESPSPSKKVKSTKSAGSSKTLTVLQTENLKTVKKLPARCAVTDKALQDPLLFKICRKLPPLRKGVFVTWSSGAGPGNFLFSQWREVCPDIDIRYIEKATGQSVVQRKHVVLTFMFSWAMCVDSKMATCISVGMAIHSALMEPSTVTTPSPKSLWSKFLTVILHLQDFERFVGFVCMVFHVKTLHAQLHCDAVTFGTRAFSKTSKPTTSAKFSRGIPSSATKTDATTTFSSDDALSWEDEGTVGDNQSPLVS